MNRKLLTLLFFTCTLSVAAYAQGTGSSGTPRAGGQSEAERAFAVTRTVTGAVAEVNDDGKVLVVTDKKGNRHEFKADARMKMKGGDKMMKDDKMAKDDEMMKDDKMAKDDKMMKDDKMAKDDKMMKGAPSFSELQVGQMVKVTYREADHTATQVAVIAAKK